MENIRLNDLRYTLTFFTVVMKNNYNYEKQVIESLKPFLQQLKKLQEIKITYGKFMRCFNLIRSL